MQPPNRWMTTGSARRHQLRPVSPKRESPEAIIISVFVLGEDMNTLIDASATAIDGKLSESPCDRAYALGRELQSLAAAQASLDHDFCVLVDRFDESGAVAYFDGIQSTAHYLAWACAMNATVAREHVRVARALRDMPVTNDVFRQGRFSYSKVRELTRLVGLVDEEELCGLALEMTASQLARSVSVQARLREPHQGAARAPLQLTADG